jgi:hypothetical protein
MPPKKKKDGSKKKKSSLEEDARAKAEAVDDIDDEDYKKSLRKECRLLEEQIRKEEDLAGLY